ncbi:copine domain-containing protein [Ditylenchus destructor]|nr:copine domain-containing protein [Ditylenchus destructor]
MVFSEELGYDPEEWEECPDPDHWLAFSFPTRVLLSILTIIVSVLFFWVIEKRKSWDKPIKAEEEKSSEKRKTEASDRQSRRDAEERRNPLEESWPQIIEENRSRTASATPRRRRSSKKALTSEEQSALSDWERQLNEVAERRLRETQEDGITRAQSSHPDLEAERGVDRLPLTDEIELTSTFGLPQNAFDNQSLISDFTGGTSAVLKDIQRLRVSECATPPSTPPGGAPSFEAHYRQMADDLKKKLTAEIKSNSTQTPHSSLADIQKQLTEQLQQRYEEDIRQAVDRLQREHADEVDDDIGEQLRHQLESQIQGVVRERWPSQGQSPEFTIGDDRDDTLKKRDVVKVGDNKDRAIDTSGQIQSAQIKQSEEFEQDGSPKKPVRGSINGKGSSSSDDGFVKVEREDEGPDELQRQNAQGCFLTPTMGTGMHREQSEPEMLTAPSPTMEEWSDSGGGISPGQRVSIDIDDTVTADDIEFVLRSGGQPQIQAEQQSPVSSNSPPEEVLDLDIGEEERLGDYGPQHQSVTIPDSLDAHRNELLLKQADDLSSAKARDTMDKPVTGEEIDYSFDEPLNQQASRIGEGKKNLTPEEKRALDAREEEQMLKLLQEYDMAAASGMLGQPSPGSQHVPSVSPLESPTGFDIVEIAPASPALPITSAPRKVHKRGSDPHSTLSEEKSRYEQFEEPIPGQVSGVVPTRSQYDSKVHQLNAGVSDVQKVPMTQDHPGALQSHLIRQGPVLESDERWSEERRNIEELERRERVFISEKPLDDDPRRLAQAETYLKDAMDFMDNREPPRRSGSSSTGVGAGGFVMEEEMLESDKGQPPAASKIKDQGPAWRSSGEKAGRDVPGLVSDTQQQNASADPTSRLVRTNEVFGKAEQAVTAGGEPSFDEEADDAVTYAPEIQSVEIPPDQISESSLNLVENLESEHHDYKPQAEAQKIDDQKSKETAAKVESATKQDKLSEPNLLESANERAGKVAEESNLRREPSPRRPSPTRRPSAPQFHILRKNDKNGFDDISTSSMSSTSKSMHKQSSLLSALGVTSTQEMLLKLPSLDALSDAMRKAGLESTNLIFGIDYTASNKYQGERSFKGRSLHHVEDVRIENPYQQVIKIMGRSLAPFATSSGIPVYGFGDSTTGDWSVFPLNGTKVEECRDLEEVLRVYNAVTPNVDLSGPTNFAPLIHKAVQLCQKNQDYHILVIIADGQVTNERATRKAIVQACQYPLSIIVVGVGDGPWDMMRVFDESLPKRPWDNFHFVEFHEIINERNDSEEASELNFAIHSLLEVPDQYQLIQKMGLLPNLKHTPATSKASTANTTPLPEREDNIEDFV